MPELSSADGRTGLAGPELEVRSSGSGGASRGTPATLPASSFTLEHPEWPTAAASRVETPADPAPGIREVTAPDPISALCIPIISYAFLPANWGGHGEDPIRGEAVADALRFLNLLPPRVPLPDVGPSGDEINFTWEGDDHLIDVGLCGDGQIHYYARIGHLGLDTARSLPFPASRLPRELLHGLTAL